MHGDFHRRTEDDPYAIVWLDDASRMILSCGEFTEATTDIAISTFREATDTAAEYCMKRGEYGERHTVLRQQEPSRFEYDRHRFRFGTLKEFTLWYNSRMHGALLMDLGETPDEAV